MATSARNWKKPGLEELPLPSGNVCKVKRPGMEKLLATGVLPDSITPLAMEAVKEAQKNGVPQDRKPKKGEEDNQISQEMMAKFLENENALADIFDAFDKVTAMCVKEPSVSYHKRERLDSSGTQVRDTDGKVLWEEIPEDERDPEVLYTDDVDSEDKTFIFQYVIGGDSDLESFRASTGNDVAALQSGDDVEMPPE